MSSSHPKLTPSGAGVLPSLFLGIALLLGSLGCVPQGGCSDCGPPPPPSVSLEPQTMLLGPGQFVRIQASSNSSEVTWKVVEVGGGSLDEISPSIGSYSRVRYRGPQSGGVYHVQALLRDYPTIIATAIITVDPSLKAGLSLDSSTVTLATNEPLTLKAKVSGSGNQVVEWLLQEPGSGTLSGGSYYSPPVRPGTFHATARAEADPNQSAILTLTIQGLKPDVKPAPFFTLPSSIRALTPLRPPQGVVQTGFPMALWATEDGALGFQSSSVIPEKGQGPLFIDAIGGWPAEGGRLGIWMTGPLGLWLWTPQDSPRVFSSTPALAIASGATLQSGSNAGAPTFWVASPGGRFDRREFSTGKSLESFTANESPSRFTSGKDGTLVWALPTSETLVRRFTDGRFEEVFVPGLTNSAEVGPGGEIWFLYHPQGTLTLGNLSSAGGVTMISLPSEPLELALDEVGQPWVLLVDQTLARWSPETGILDRVSIAPWEARPGLGRMVPNGGSYVARAWSFPAYSRSTGTLTVVAVGR